MGANSEESILVFNFENSLLKSSSTFPFFMLVALEGGSFLRALLLLLLYPVIWLLGQEDGEDIGIKVMAFVSFCGLRKDCFRVGRAILPKHFLESMGMEGAEIVVRKGSWKRRIGVSQMPHVMVEPLLKEYLDVDVAVGREMNAFAGFYTGIMEESKRESIVMNELNSISSDCVVGFTGINSGSRCKADHHLFSLCKINKMMTVEESEKKSWCGFSKESCPNPFIFHDGRIAFLPTPMATLTMFIWFPFGLALALLRGLVFVALPYNLSVPILIMLGLNLTVINNTKTSTDSLTASGKKNHLFVINHRTLMDPIYVSVALRKQVRAVTYSMSRVSEILSPIKTVRMTRNDREEDRRRMQMQLKSGPLVVCPEGTTCREPFLLRFSPLFTEVTDEVVPVAVNLHFSMFYGTTAGGFKVFDPLFFLMNPSSTYELEFLEKIKTSMGDDNYMIANKVQKALADALGFSCTKLKRKDKYMVLAGNEGKV